MPVKLHRLIDGDITKCRLNNTLHGRSVYRIKDVPGHNVFRAYNSPGRGDGLDVFTSKKTPAPAGACVYATHTGQIVECSSANTKLAHLRLNGVQNGHEIETVYAHIKFKPGVVSGVHVLAGECIGWIGNLLADPHLHVEVWIDDVALSGKKPIDLAKKIAALTV